MNKKFRITINGKSFEVEAELIEEKKARRASHAGSVASTAPISKASKPSAPPAGAIEGAIPSPLAGKVVSIDVNPGDTVNAGDPIMVLEAMKMNTVISAPAPGTVDEILVNAGDSVEEGQPLMKLS